MEQQDTLAKMIVTSGDKKDRNLSSASLGTADVNQVPYSATLMKIQSSVFYLTTFY